MLKVYHINCSKEAINQRLKDKIKIFNSESFFPITVKQKEDHLLLLTDSILTRGFYSVMRIRLIENGSDIHIETKTRMSWITRQFLAFPIIFIIYKFREGFYVESSDIVIVIFAVFLLKYYLERRVFTGYIEKSLQEMETL